MLVCGIAERLRRGLPIADMAPAALEAAYMAWRRQPESNVLDGLDVGKALDGLLLATPELAEIFFRASIEPQLLAKRDHVQDLYQLTHTRRWEKLAGSLAPEWLERYPDLPLCVQVELLNAAVRHSDRRILKSLVAMGRTRATRDGEVAIAWLATDFIADFEGARAALKETAAENRSLIWPIRSRCGGRHGSASELSLAQRVFIIEAFGGAWPLTQHPRGGSTGDSNPWDASQFIGHMINTMAGDASPEATEALAKLADDAAPSYQSDLRHALALQRRLRRDREYQPAQLSQVASVSVGALPETVDDMRAYFGDRVTTLQARMHATNTDMWEAYWNGGTPRPENFCRNPAGRTHLGSAAVTGPLRARNAHARSEARRHRSDPRHDRLAGRNQGAVASEGVGRAHRSTGGVLHARLACRRPWRLHCAVVRRRARQKLAPLTLTP